jgi:hypothetical protein
MEPYSTENPMVWVIVETIDREERFVGQHDPTRDIAFIPFFKEKEEAQGGLRLMDRGRGREYEVQAVRYLELSRDAASNGFLLFLVDADGKILEKIKPHRPPHA